MGSEENNRSCSSIRGDRMKRQMLELRTCVRAAAFNIYMCSEFEGKEEICISISHAVYYYTR